MAIINALGIIFLLMILSHVELETWIALALMVVGLVICGGIFMAAAQ